MKINTIGRIILKDGKLVFERFGAAVARKVKLGTSAFANIVNNATTTEEGFVPDARVVAQQQQLIDQQQEAIESLNSALKIMDLGIIRKQVFGNTFTITVSEQNTLREPVLVLIGAQAHRQEGAAIFTPCGTSFSSLGGAISMSKSENVWTVTGSDSGYGLALIIGSKNMISMLE